MQRLNFVVVLVGVFCFFVYTNACSCFRDPWMLTPKCGCDDFDTPCGVVICPRSSYQSCPKSGKCGSNVGTICQSSKCQANTYQCQPTVCEYGVIIPACASYKDTSNICFVCDNPSPVCSCLKTVNDCGCGCDDARSFIYFPEVEYPVTVIAVKPFYYSGCLCY